MTRSGDREIGRSGDLGTAKVGYMPPEAGPFRCSNCKHYVDKRDGSGCDDREVALDLGTARNGLAPVSPDGCCNEYKPKTKAEARSIGMRLVAIGGSRKLTDRS